MNGAAKKKKATIVASETYNWEIGLYGFKISLWNLCGVLVCLFCGGLYSYIISQIHDARLFFTGITELEREISFRTENGLYYSYYKQLVHSPSFLQGIGDLLNDSNTEHPSQINVLSRMNVYQEVLLAFLYRFCPFITANLPPIFFYIYSIFLLHSILCVSLFLLSWSVSGTWLSGLFTFILYVYHWADVTRVEIYMPLRENFALPFLWAQLLLIHIYFKQDFNLKYKLVVETLITVCSFLFALTWQFNQFALLLQAGALVACQVLDLVPLPKLRMVYRSLLTTMVLVCLLQFCNTMILSGPLVSLLISALLLLTIQERFPHHHSKSAIRHISQVIINIVVIIITSVIVNFVLKTVLQHQADEHINRFIFTKFGFNSSIDFDVKLYLCNGGFNFLDTGFFGRIGVAMLLYFFSHVCLILLGIVSVLATVFSIQRGWGSVFSLRIPPELAYHTFQMLAFGALAVIVLRMKYFWTPYICVFAPVCVLKAEAWLWVLARLFKDYKGLDRRVKEATSALAILLIAYYGKITYTKTYGIMTDLREFYDPDTVDLMLWIRNSTAVGSSFSGSMQLMAAVKLSADRPVTNHPHYEDKSLRLKTKDLMKYYGRFSAEEVSGMLKAYRTDFIVLEDSICRAPFTDGCGMTYIMDAELGLELDDKGVVQGGYTSLPPRFCDKVREPDGPYSKFFKLVMSNKTFRIYKVL